MAAAMNFPTPILPAVRRSNLIVARAVDGRRSPHPDNTPGDIYVDHTCIDCDTCRWMAPNVFTRVKTQSIVYKQPTSQDERTAALKALLACPTASIRTVKPPKEINQVHDLFPLPIDEERQGVYHCGFHSDKSFGAAPYLITRPEGNILFDSPKFTEKLAKKLEKMGGIRYLVLSHIDDVGDHMLWQKRLGCERIMHKLEVEEGTKDVEIQLEGEGPWKFLGEGFEIILTPGHTKGSICLFHKPHKMLFTGDHLFTDHVGKELFISHQYVFYSVEKQVESMKPLLPLDFLWVLPGHGRRIKFESFEEKNAALQTLIAKENA